MLLEYFHFIFVPTKISSILKVSTCFKKACSTKKSFRPIFSFPTCTVGKCRAEHKIVFSCFHVWYFVDRRLVMSEVASLCDCFLHRSYSMYTKWRKENQGSILLRWARPPLYALAL